jgi:hypothetical protein
METPLIRANAPVHALSARHRVILLGGMAVIGHGLSRKTKDVDIWLEPMKTAAAWATALKECLGAFPGLYFWSLETPA